MSKIKLILLLVNVSISCLGQINFEKGYFVNNKGELIECLIKNNEWLRNPKEFRYKLSENGEINCGDIKDVKEFAIFNSAKYVRANVDIDTSCSMLNKLSTTGSPLWKRKQLFLKVLIEGKASLYYYNEENFERFFYSCNDSIIKQLVYKEYFYNNDHTAFNNSFRQQLLSDVNCSQTTVNSVKYINYNQRELEKYFHRYNSCIDTSYKVVAKKQAKSELNIGISAGLDYSSLSISNSISNYNTDFGNELNYRFGLEFEYILPFNKRKWRVAIESGYQSYKSQTQNTRGYFTVDYTLIDLSLGIKHYFFLNDKAKFFVDCYFNSLVSKTYNSKVGIKVLYSAMSYLNVKRSGYNFSVGGGFEYNRINAELRYFSKKDLLSDYLTWDSNYSRLSLIIGYKIITIKRNKP